MNDKESPDNTSLDDFIGGKISLFQPLNGYRVNTDSILLAAAVDAKKGQRVLELGCGVGAVLFALMSRIDGLTVVGVEAQKQYARLAIRNAAHNRFKATILECDVSAVPNVYKNSHFDHVVLNPPFFKSASSMQLMRGDKNFAKRELDFSLDDWIDVAIRRCSLKGEVVMIHQAERLAQIMKCVEKRLGDIKILPISSFKEEQAKRILVKGKKGSLSPLKILAPLVMHENREPNHSGAKYTNKVEKILRMGKILDWIKQN